MGAGAALIAALAGTVASWALVVGAMEAEWVFLPGTLAITVVGATVLTVVLGLIGTIRPCARQRASFAHRIGLEIDTLKADIRFNGFRKGSSMSDRWSQDDTPAAVAGEARARSIDAGLRIYMTKVYNYMAMGLWSRPRRLFRCNVGHLSCHCLNAADLRTGFCPARYGDLAGRPPARHVVGARADHVLGVCRSDGHVPVLRTARIHGRERGAHLAVTAGSFGALSLYGYTTKRDLAPMGAFLFMGLIGIILASIVNILSAVRPAHDRFSARRADFCRSHSL